MTLEAFRKRQISGTNGEELPPQEKPLVYVNGEGLTFTEIYEKLGPKVCGIINYKSGNPDVAEDLTADVFERVLRKGHTYEDRGVPFRAWVFEIARNLLKDNFRRPKVLPGGNGEVVDSSAQAALENSLQRADLEQAMGGLDPHYRRVLELRFLEGLSPAETAEATGRTVYSVKKVQGRALGLLRRRLQP